MRKLTATFGLLMALALSAGPAFAFEQTAPAGTQPGSAQSAPGIQGPSTVPGISTAAPTAGQRHLAPELNSDESYGIRIPGLGSFNFLPKMDFGLELLYGEPPKVDSPVDPLNDQDVTIRGSVKRRF